MAWSPAEPAVQQTFSPPTVPPPPPVPKNPFLFPRSTTFDSTLPGNVAAEFQSRLNLNPTTEKGNNNTAEEGRKKQSSSAPFVFGKTVQQPPIPPPPPQASFLFRGSDEPTSGGGSVRKSSRRRPTPHRTSTTTTTSTTFMHGKSPKQSPLGGVNSTTTTTSFPFNSNDGFPSAAAATAAPFMQQQQQQQQVNSPPPVFVFGAHAAAAPPQTTAAATATFSMPFAPQPEQQQHPSFVSLSQLRPTVGTTKTSPSRRRPRGGTLPTKTAATSTGTTRKSRATSTTTTTTKSTTTTTTTFTAPSVPSTTTAADAAADAAWIAASQRAEREADRCRVLGNELFKQRHYEDASKHYTQAINVLMPYVELHNQVALLLSNRAAASLALSRPLQALQDCRMGLYHKPLFLKCALRMATCYCRLGEYQQAMEVVTTARLNMGVLYTSELQEIEAKEREVAACEAGLLDALHALGHGDVIPAPAVPPPTPAPKKLSLTDAMKHLEVQAVHFPHAEVFHAARCDALLRLGQWEAVAAAVEQLPHRDTDRNKIQGVAWRVWIRAQVAFYQGKAAEAVKLLLEVQGGVAVLSNSNSNTLEMKIVPLPSVEDIHSLISILQESEKLRSTGNVAIAGGKYEAALEAYTAALSGGKLSPALSSVLYCNRAAAHQGLGNLALAIADCCRAKALAPGYAKAHSRLAAIASDVGMHSAAADELTAALSTPNLPPASRHDYQKRLKAAKEAAAPRRTFYGATLNAPSTNYYKLLGVEKSCPVEHVRKVYKKLALQLHPDKSTSACRFASKICSTGAELTEPAAALQRRLQDGATWLFKCLGEANEILSSPEKRRELDDDLAANENQFRGNGRNGYSGGHGSPSSSSSSHSYGHNHGGGGGAYGPYYRPHAQPSYGYGRPHSYGGGGGGGGGGGARADNFRHYW